MSKFQVNRIKPAQSNKFNEPKKLDFFAQSGNIINTDHQTTSNVVTLTARGLTLDVRI